MRWYDLFSIFYDRSIEPLYRPQRAAAVAALDLAPGLSVLDCPCGTGQSFDAIAPVLRPGGRLVGVDRSRGMLGRAHRRVASRRLDGVHLVGGEIGRLDDAGPPLREATFDRLLVFLGMTVLPDQEAGFTDIWRRLRPGGRCVIVDVYNPAPGIQGISVKLVAQSDMTRRSWEPLERRADGFERRALPSTRKHGGELFLATGLKPG